MILYLATSYQESANLRPMHEFSLATDVINLAQNEAEKNGATIIREISIEIGDLSGVEAQAFESALELLVKESVLGDAKIIIIRNPGIGRCDACDRDFEMHHRLASCPDCHCFPSQIKGGEEFRVISLLVD